MLARRIVTLAEYLEDPQLFRLRLAGGDTALYRRLNQPWVRALRFQSALDIGANVGQFAQVLRAVVPAASIYSFEPLPDCFARLQRRMAGAPKFTAFNLGVGERAGRLTIERNDFTPSSSFLRMAGTHQSAFPYTRTTRAVEVAVERLDDIARRLDLPDPLLVKIDVQGYEDRVLRGGEATLRRARAIFIEASFETLYEGQVLFDSLYRQLVAWGFVFHGALDQLRHPDDDRCLQADCVFIRPASARSRSAQLDSGGSSDG